MPGCTTLETLLARAFDDMRKKPWADLAPDEYEQRRADFIFHMTDWEDDLEQLSRLFLAPES